MEIGSEFWKKDNHCFELNETMFLSGRTALDAIIRDAVKCKGVTAAILPSYCCDSMIEPFIRNGLSIRFYEVSINENGLLCAILPSPERQEVLLYMNYFGAAHLSGLTIDNIRQWSVTIEDLTHTCFCENYKSIADYSFESYRKWFALEGLAIARKKNGVINPPGKLTSYEFCENRRIGFDKKNQFMEGLISDRSQFNDRFKAAGKILVEDYVDRAPSSDDIVTIYNYFKRINDIKKRRKDNAKQLIEGIKDIKEMHILVENTNPNDCPLFLPVYLDTTIRDNLRSYLIQNQIFCPVHWSLSRYHSCLTAKETAVYHMVMSLVCDQRYSQYDIERFVSCIRDFFNA